MSSSKACHCWHHLVEVLLVSQYIRTWWSCRMEQLAKMLCMPAANDGFFNVMQSGANIQLNHF